MTFCACRQARSTSPPLDADRIPAANLWQVKTLSEGWTYRTGGSPRLSGGQWAWAQADFDDGNWRGQARPGVDVTANGQRDLWVRIRLPAASLAHPLLFLKLVANEQDAYLDGKRVELQAFTDHPWEQHLNSERHFYLHPDGDVSGHLLTIHLRSAGARLGIYFPAYLGEESAVGLTIIRDALFPLALVAVTGAIFIATFLLFLVSRRDLALLYFSLTSLYICVFMFTTSGVPSLLIGPGTPAFALVRYVNPIGLITLCCFVLKVLNHKYLRWMKVAIPVFAVFAVSQAIATLYDIRITDVLEGPGLILQILTCMGLGVSAALKTREGDPDSKLLCAGFALGLVLVLPTPVTIVGLAVVPMRWVLLRIAPIVFLSALGAILIRRFLEVHRQLGTYSGMLSEQVHVLEGRNTEIQTLNQELRRQIEQRSDRMIDLLTRSSPGTKVVPAQVLEAGQVLCSHYRVLRALGQGAMGSVFEVERISDGLHLAAKLMSGKSKRTAMIRFIREARILAQLKHPNLVAILDVDITEEGGLFLIMELVNGKTLQDAKERCRDLALAAAVLRQICLGLQAVHEQGIVHRDLKPANVLLAETADGPVVKIADFGISTLGVGANTPSPAEVSISEAPRLSMTVTSITPPAVVAALPHFDTPRGAHLTQTGVLIGTPLYMAPELASGSRNAPRASDIWSLGVIAFELLTGKMPFSVPPVVTVWNQQSVVVPRLQTQRADLPEELATVLDRCLSLDPSQRPSLAELLSTIAAFS
jgi:serine/threonine protein kinase